MRKLMAAAGMLVLLPMAVLAQENSVPQAELFAGFSYLRMEKTDQMGWNGAFAVNINKNLGIVTDLSGYYNSKSQKGGGISANSDRKIHSVLFGPRVSDPRGKWNPFAQALFGWARINTRLSSSGGSGTAFSSSAADNAFAAAAGGGLDYNFSDRSGLRLIQVEYFMFQSNNQKPQGVRLSGGVKFNLGRKAQ